MVEDSVWIEAGLGEGLVCIGCLEERLGRLLVPEDFEAKIPLNHADDQSVRLRERLGLAVRTTPSGVEIDDSICGWEGCSAPATLVAGIVFGPFHLGPVEIPVCAEHGERARELLEPAPGLRPCPPRDPMSQR